MCSFVCRSKHLRQPCNVKTCILGCRHRCRLPTSDLSSLSSVRHPLHFCVFDFRCQPQVPLSLAGSSSGTGVRLEFLAHDSHLETSHSPRVFFLFPLLSLLSEMKEKDKETRVSQTPTSLVSTRRGNRENSKQGSPAKTKKCTTAPPPLPTHTSLCQLCVCYVKVPDGCQSRRGVPE